MAWWTSLIGPVVGALAGGGDDETTTTSKSDPWGPAQPYMLRNLQDTEKLGDYYKKNPFNPQQTESYSNLFNDNRNFRNNIAPGLMDFANKGMTSQYQRARGGRPGDVAGYGGDFQPGGVRDRVMGGGLLSGPFSVSGGQSGGQSGSPGGLLDLNGAQNPFANGGVTQAPKTVTEEMIDELKKQVYGLGDSPGNDSGDNQGGGTQSAFNVNAPEAAWLDAIMPGLGAAYNAAMRNGFNASPGFMSTPASINAYSDARLARQEGAGGDYGFGGYGDFGAGDYGDGTDR